MSILASLAKAYERIPDASAFGYSTEKIGFLISLNEDGTVATRRSTCAKLKARRERPARCWCLQPPRRLGEHFAELSLGQHRVCSRRHRRDDKKEKRLADEHAAFVLHHLDVLKQANDPGLGGARRFLETWTPDQFDDPLGPRR